MARPEELINADKLEGASAAPATSRQALGQLVRRQAAEALALATLMRELRDVIGAARELLGAQAHTAD